MTHELFFSDHPVSQAAYQHALSVAQKALAQLPTQPYSGLSPEALAQRLPAEIFPNEAKAPAELAAALQTCVAHAIAVWHPRTAAHLHTPVLLPSLTAEAVLSALNPSMDSFDQAPAATMVELALLDWLVQLCGLPKPAGGTMTAGGTQSNYMGLLLARDQHLTARGWAVREKGLPPDANRLRVLCSEIAHFSVDKAMMQLGLGTEAVVKVAVDKDFQLDPADLAHHLARLRANGAVPFALVATAGTTDFGSLDPIGPMADLAAEYGLWLHVDAAYGSALLLSEKYAPRLAGLHRAQSITLDFHKAFFQPISCGAFLVADAAHFEHLNIYADYLNSEGRAQAGIPDLVARSVLTTRRFDALKVWYSLQALGRTQFAALVEQLVALAEHAAHTLRADPRFELLHTPTFGCVVFRYIPNNPNTNADTLNDLLPQHLFDTGQAVIGHTRVNGRACLKFTLNNPCTTGEEVEALLRMIKECGEVLESEGAGV